MKTSFDSDLSRILVTREDINARLDELGREITTHYRESGSDEITMVCITNGAIIFAADLLRRLDLHARLDCVRVSSYQSEDKPVTEPEIINQIRLDITDRHVLLVDDILDTGKTLEKLIGILDGLSPKSLKTCVLLEKDGRRQSGCKADYIGFHIPNEFVVGYGLDFAERYRNLPHIGVLKTELQTTPHWS